MGNTNLINPIKNKAGTAILESNKTDFKERSIKKNKKENNKMRKKFNHENIILNVSVCNRIGSKSSGRL